jgi:hypothetical protein
MHVAKGKPKQFTPEEGSAFEAADNLFRGCIIGVLAENLVDSYIVSKRGKKCGMLLRLNMEFPMQAVSCMSWNSSLTTGWLKTILWWNMPMKYIHRQKILEIVARRTHVHYPTS